MNDDLLEFIKKYALKEYGIRIQEHQIEKISSGIEDYKQKNNIMTDDELYNMKIKTKDSEFRKLFCQLATINESYFFRDATCFKAIKDHILPNIISQKERYASNEIKIWSAGCASGQ